MGGRGGAPLRPAEGRFGIGAGPNSRPDSGPDRIAPNAEMKNPTAEHQR